MKNPPHRFAKWIGWFLLLLIGFAPPAPSAEIPFTAEPYSGAPGSLRRFDPRLLQIGGEQDALSIRSISFRDRVEGPESPHVPYARPWYRGPLRVLYITVVSYTTDPRSIIELQERLEADIRRFVVPDAEMKNLTEVTLPRYLKMLEADYDVIVLGGLDWIVADERIVKPLLAKVEKGTGLVFWETLHYQKEPNTKALAPLLLLQGRGNGTGQPKVTAQDHPAVNGIPFDLMHFTTYRKTATAPGARAVANAGDDVMVAVGQHGQGRVVGLAFNNALFSGYADQIGIHYRHWEYVFALQARCALWAARREPETKLKLTLPPTLELGTPLAAEVSVQGGNELLKGCELKVAWYDDEHQLVAEKIVRLDGPGTQSLTCPKPLRAGQTLVDARLIDRKKRAMDWASGGTVVKTAGELALKIEPERIQEGQAVNLSVTGTKPPDTRVHFRVTDAYRRLVLDVTGNEGTATWKAENVRGAIFRVVADIENGRGETLARYRGFFTCPKYGIDDYYNYFWPGTSASFNLDRTLSLYRECGIEGIYNCPWSKELWYATTANHMKNMGGNLAVLWSWGNILKNPLLTDAARAEVKDRGFKDSVPLVRKFGMTWGSLQDEGVLGVEGYGFDDVTLGAFRKDLQQRYANVEALNRQWGTTFADWNQVKPSKFEEMKGQTNYSRWLEFRRFMDLRGALQMKEVVDELKTAAGARDVPVGIEGIFGFTDHHVPFGLTDYTFMTHDAGMSLMPYNGPECFQEGGGISNDSDLDSFLNPQRAPGGWTGYSEPKWKQALQPWWCAFHGYAGMGYFAAGIYVDTAGGLYENARWIEEPTRPLRQGVGKLLINSRRHFDPVAIYFDMGNLQLAWIVARTQDKGWMERLVVDGKASMERMMQDLSVTPGYVTPASIADGALKNYRMVILTGTLRISKSTLQSLKAFAEAGGVVVADGLTGLYDEAGRPTDSDHLKDLFGVVRKSQDVKLLPGQYSLGVLKQSELFPSLPMEWMKGTLFEEGLEVADGKAMGAHVEIAKAPGFIEKRIGKGRAMLINAVNTTYLQDADERDLKVWQALLQDSGVKPLTRVCDDGAPLFCYDVKTFEGEGILLAGIIRSPRFGAVNPLEAEVTFERDGEIYDVIGGRRLGSGKMARMELLPGKPALVAQVGRKINGVKVKADGKVKRGGLVNVVIGVEPAPCHDTVLRMEVYRADGRLDEALTSNLTAKGGRYSGALPIALDDPEGKWRVNVREVVSHKTGEATFQVR